MGWRVRVGGWVGSGLVGPGGGSGPGAQGRAQGAQGRGPEGLGSEAGAQGPKSGPKGPKSPEPGPDPKGGAAAREMFWRECCPPALATKTTSLSSKGPDAHTPFRCT